MWDSSAAVWSGHLASYPTAIATREKTQRKSDLVSLDSFVWSELQSKVESRSRKPPHINSDEYSRVVSWKLKRGKWRPRLQSYADSLDNDDVVNATTEAFAALKKGKVQDALKLLVELKGCGPATASAVLAAVDKDVPFMSDELLQEATGERKYTVAAYTQLVKKVKHKAQQLSKADPAHKWTARDIEQAMFAAHHAGGEDPADLVERPSYSSQARAAKGKNTATSTSKSPKKSGIKEKNPSTTGRAKLGSKVLAKSSPKRKALEGNDTPPPKRTRNAGKEAPTASSTEKRRTRSTGTLKQDKAGGASAGLRRSTRTRKRNGG